MDERNQAVPQDPSGIDEPHDVLAAEEFGIGARDDRLPPDPTGLHEPHDVLAAEEFAMPAGVEGIHASAARNWTPYVLAAATAVLLLLRLRRRR